MTVVNETLSPSEMAIRESQIRRRNTIFLVVLLALALGLMLSSYPLFNYYWDPHQSETVRSH